MENNPVRIKAGIAGTVCGCPAEAYIQTGVSGSVLFEGRVKIVNKNFVELIFAFDESLKNSDIAQLVADIVGSISATFSFAYDSAKLTRVDLNLNDTLQCLYLKNLQRSLFVLRLTNTASASSSNAVWSVVKKAIDLIGLQKLVLAYQQGSGISYKELTGEETEGKIPGKVASANWIVYTSFAFDAGSNGSALLRQIFKKAEFECYLAIGEDSFSGIVNLPVITSRFFCSKDLYLAVGLESGSLQLELQGSFYFPLLSDQLIFTCNCQVSATKFLISAIAQAEKPLLLPFLDFIYFKAAGILIGIENGGITVGLMADFQIRELSLFGAAVILVEGEIPVPTMLSTAISRLSLLTLVKNLTGVDTNKLPGLEAFDFFEIDMLEADMVSQPFDTSLLPAIKPDKITDYFNRYLKDPTLKLSATDLAVQPDQPGMGGGCTFVDKKRMRHYYISSTGTVALKAQFYYSVSPETKKFGDYEINPGWFLCGVLRLFKKFEIKVLFSFFKEEGFLAFAQISDIDLGIVKIGHSATSSTFVNPMEPPANSLMRALIPAKTNSLIFYLSANKRDISFYLDGSVSILNGLISFDARVVYVAKRVAINTVFNFLGVQTTLVLDASYEDFSSLRFNFYFKLDATKLLAALQKVTQEIDSVINLIKAEKEKADNSLNNAQNDVNKLYNQISYLNSLISSCQHDISSASWWSKVFVAIAKGAEIAAYEIAKAGIYTAIGVATAAIEVARAAVAVAGKAAQGVLEIVNAALRTATSLFFVKLAELSIEANTATQKIAAKIEFVAFGKNYGPLEFAVEPKLLSGDLFKSLSDKLLSFLSGDMEKLKKGEPLTTVRMLKKSNTENEDFGKIPDIAGASTAIRRAGDILVFVQNEYRSRFNEELPEFEAINSSFIASMSHSESMLELAKQATRTADKFDFADAVSGLDYNSDSELLDNALKNFDAVSEKHTSVLASTTAISEVREQINAIPTTLNSNIVAVNEQEMAQFVVDIEKQINAIYNPAEQPGLEKSMIRKIRAEQPDHGFINLAKESALHSIFDKTLQELNADVPEMEFSRKAKSKGRRSKETYRQRFNFE